MSSSIGPLFTAKQKLFIAEYMADCNGTRAAKVAGYVNPVVAANKLLSKTPHVRDEVQRRLKLRFDKLELDGERLLREVAAIALRDPLQLVNPDTGELETDMRKLPEIVRRTIDSIKQKVVYDPITGEVLRTETELKLVPKLGAIELAMKHFGMLAPDTKVDVNIATGQIDWDEYYSQPLEPDNVIDVEPSPEIPKIETSNGKHEGNGKH